MSREILFRGKTKNRRDAVWIEGSLMRVISKYSGEPAIFIYDLNTEVDGRGWVDNYYGEEVDPETVGQFTGLLDKNGVKVFEGDYIKLDDYIKTVFELEDGPVVYTGGTFRIDNYNASVLYSLYCIVDYNFTIRGEVIGNIYDNPDLVKLVKG